MKKLLVTSLIVAGTFASVASVSAGTLYTDGYNSGWAMEAFSSAGQS